MKHQRGFLTAYIALGVGAVILVMGLGWKLTASALDRERTAFATFKAQVEANGKIAEAKAKEKEVRDAKQIQVAVAQRDVALGRLRDATSAASRRLSDSPAAPAGSQNVYLESAAYTAAFREFREQLERSMAEAIRLAAEGDAAQIDAQTLLNAWPSPK